MPSPIFNQQNQQRPSFMSALNQLKQNPAQILGMKYNIPQGMTNPEEILQHLLTTETLQFLLAEQLVRLLQLLL